MKVRRLAQDEWPFARALRLAALDADADCFGGSRAAAADLDENGWRAELDGDQWLVACAGSVPVGLVVFYPRDTSPDGAPQLGAMWVDPAWRRRGVAAVLEAEVRAAARSAGAAEVGLWVTDGNDTAREVYERLGYRATGATKPAPRDPAVLMHRMLRGTGP